MSVNYCDLIPITQPKNEEDDLILEIRSGKYKSEENDVDLILEIRSGKYKSEENDVDLILEIRS